jgi:hypothetical protein
VDVTGISLLDLSRKSCSARHCASVKLTVAEVAERVRLHKEEPELTPAMIAGKTRKRD